MNEADRETLRRSLPLLIGLLKSVAAGERNSWEAADDYLHLHSEVRRVLAAYGESCVCPWPNIYGWAGTAAKWAERGDDWNQLLARQAAKARILCGLDEPPPWELVDYFRNGDPSDTPFWAEFFDSLEDHKQVILRTHLEKELAYRGPAVCDDPATGHTWRCSGRPGNTTKVFMYKIRQGHGLGEVVLRVFFVTDRGYKLVLLHGYDKGADADPASERREANEACARRVDEVSRR